MSRITETPCDKAGDTVFYVSLDNTLSQDKTEKLAF